MNRIFRLAPLLALTLAACGGEPDGAATAGALTRDECTLLADRHRDMALAGTPPGQEDTMRTFVEAAHQPMIDECVAGNLFDREAHACVVAAAAGSAESHACIQAAHDRG
jgi:hypothetical protein